jgi:valacyclovir hydrolase
MPHAEVLTGARLYYEDLGSGEPLLLIHGLMDVPRVHYQPLLNWLSARYRVIAPSLRGYYESTPKPRDFPPDFYRRDALDVLALMDAIGLEQAHILGYSDGGEVALLAPGMMPARFQSVVAWGAVGYFGPGMHAAAARAYPGDWIPESDRLLHGITDIDAIMRQWVESVQAIVDAGGDVSLSLAANITCPLLLLLGDRDRLNPAAYGQRLVDQTAAGRLVVVPDCGHSIHNEQWPVFQQVVGAFLAQVSSG